METTIQPKKAYRTLTTIDTKTLKEKYNITYDQYNEYQHYVFKYDRLFWLFLELGNPFFTLDIPTAAVVFDPYSKKVNYYWNPKFWNYLKGYGRKAIPFVICHEILHVFLKHLFRGGRIFEAREKFFKLDKEKNPKDDREILQNILFKATDIVVNELLVYKFGFKKQDMPTWKKWIWLETVFSKKDLKGSNPVLPNKSMEYYFKEIYNRLEIVDCECKVYVLGGKGDGGEGGNEKGKYTIDDHSGFDDPQTPEEQKAVDEFIKEVIDGIKKELTDEEREDFNDKIKDAVDPDPDKASQKAGTMAGSLTFRADTTPVKKKRKWETVINKRLRKYKIDRYEARDTFIRRPKLLEALNIPGYIPGIIDDPLYKKRKINLVFYQDVSGSCVHLIQRFFNAAKSLPEDVFDINLFAFDTRIIPVSLKEGTIKEKGGGTYFHILEQHAQSLKQKTGRYPDEFFVVTDGYGDNIIPEHPERWHWFLTHDYRSCIPDTCDIHMLRDFE